MDGNLGAGDQVSGYRCKSLSETKGLGYGEVLESNILDMVVSKVGSFVLERDNEEQEGGIMN